MSTNISPFSKPKYVMLKPAGAACNMRCDYCYYLEKKNLYQQQRRQILSEDMLEKFVEQYMNIQTTPSVLFTWHGGEPLMRPITFYQKALELQKKYANGRQIDNAIQTNGTLITDEWARFFRKNNFLVGVSIDGPEEMHNAYRLTQQGKPSWQQVMRGIRTLNRHNVEWNAMATVNNLNADSPEAFYHFFKEINCHFIQFTPVVERLYRHQDGRTLASPIDGAWAELAPFSVTPKQWGNFLCRLFDEWVREDVGNYFIQMFDSTLAGWMDMEPSVCSLAKTCGHAAVMEANGDIYVCDHYVFPQFKLGNIAEHTLTELMYSAAQNDFGQNKEKLLTTQCRQCDYLFACHGECPRNRFSISADGQKGHNYLCQGYYRFFKHVSRYMDYMKYQLQHEQAPANIMEWIKSGEPEYRH
ncbi:anaerobic sulfatase-maturating enzyme [Bacteroidaceae bacterium]|uniref:anaerobic sulfatase-maturation protein n=1 Tax=Prevotella sp. MGM2 TaxID=2033406 RepID=UPI000CE9D226|nr:anaerobic sulfatase-maturation protein [Prevotella sp. MGM2]GFI35367.1 anaerobic sulfatase-maturating enzyme [Bacteroidaceae bacterium]